MTTWPVVRTYSGSALDTIKMPVGGIGTGCISFGGRGQLVDWELFNRPAKGFTPANCFFAISVLDADGTRTTRVLERALGDRDLEGPHGSPARNAGLPRFAEGEFDGAYPLGQVRLADPDVPVTAHLQAFNPLIPGDADASGHPAFVYRTVITNPGDHDLEVTVAGSVTHPYGTAFARVDHTGTTVISSSAGVEETDATNGTLALTSLEPADSDRLGWARLSWGDSLLDFWDDLDGDGRLDRRDDQATPATASLTQRQTIEAGESATFTFVISWHFPHRYGWQDHPGQEPPWVGNHYAGRYADAAEVATTVITGLDDLERRTLDFVSSVTDSALPTAVQDAALSTLAVLKSPTCFRIEDGTFLGWEGTNDTTGSCHGSCTHVWNYQYALEALFPELAWSMREVEFRYATDDRGMMSFRAGLPLATEGTSWRIAAADGQCGTIVRLHRLWKSTGDDDRLRALWPKVRAALEFAWIEHGWDGDRDGLMEGCQHNTMDVEYYGPSGVNQSWYLAALASAAELAAVVGDHDFAATCEAIKISGAQLTDDRLFNGDYYQQEVLPPHTAEMIAEGLRIRYDRSGADEGSDDLDDPDLQIGAGCTGDQLAGHSMALLSGIDTGLDPDHVRKSLRSVVDHNFLHSLGKHMNHLRTYAAGDEAGMIISSYPHGDRPRRPFPYANEVWTGIEYTAAIGLVQIGELEAAEQIVTAVRDRFDGTRRNPFNEIECGHHYVRSMAAWGLVEAWPR